MKSGFLLKSYPVQLEAVEVTEEVLPLVPLYKWYESMCVDVKKDFKEGPEKKPLIK